MSTVNPPADQPRNHPTGKSRFSAREQGAPEIEVVPDASAPVDENGREIRPGFEFWACSRCSGKGTLRGYSHVVGGTCFACGGTGGEWVADTVAKRRRKATANRDRKRQDEQAARQAALSDSRRDQGWTLDDCRDVVLDEASAQYVYAQLWSGHEDHPNFPGAFPSAWLVRPEE